MQRLGPTGLAAVQLGIGPGEIIRLTAIDLAAVAASLVQQDRAHACLHAGLRRACPGWPCTNDNDPWAHALFGHDASGWLVRMRWPEL